MTLREKYDKLRTGIISGILLPVITAFIIFFFSKGNPDFPAWLSKISRAGIESHIITLCVIPNILIFLLFNQFDMLRASRGVLGVTIFWAVIVFGVYFLK